MFVTNIFPAQSKIEVCKAQKKTVDDLHSPGLKGFSSTYLLFRLFQTEIAEYYQTYDAKSDDSFYKTADRTHI